MDPGFKTHRLKRKCGAGEIKWLVVLAELMPKLFAVDGYTEQLHIHSQQGELGLKLRGVLLGFWGICGIGCGMARRWQCGSRTCCW